MEQTLWAAIGYLFGSFPTGYLTVKIMKGERNRLGHPFRRYAHDLRQHSALITSEAI